MGKSESELPETINVPGKSIKYFLVQDVLMLKPNKKVTKEKLISMFSKIEISLEALALLRESILDGNHTDTTIL